MRERRPALVLATAAGGARGLTPLAAAVAVEAARRGAPAALIELEREPRRRSPTLLASDRARALEAGLRSDGLAAAARGHVCHLALPAADGGPAALAAVLDLIAAVDARPAAVDVATALAVAVLPSPLWRRAVDEADPRAEAALIRVDLPDGRSLAALAVADLRRRGIRARVAKRPLGRLAARRALAGIDPGGESSRRARRLASGLLGRSEGQALPAVLGACAAVALATLALASIGGALTGKGRLQRAADLAAISAARSLRDDVPRLLAPPRLPNGAPNPRHLPRPLYLARARRAAIGAGRQNGVDAARMGIAFPDASSAVPLRAKVRIAAELVPGSPARFRAADRALGRRRSTEVVAAAVAEAAPPAGSWTGLPETASGGGYSGPLVYRQGGGMRPDVAAGFDRMAAAARRDGIALAVVSAYRSDAEQAALFAANPDPTWVAPPGRSLHRCATELDLGPSSAYRWLAAHARRFGFVRRYSWEEWHFGFVAGPPPCSPAGGSIGAGGDGGAGGGLPSFVPARFAATIMRAAARRNVSAPLLAAQIEAESGFDPDAVSPAGALGISQFMPATAAAVGLRDPFDAAAAIDAQARLMSGLLRRFGSIPLALAAYNAGPGAVAGCDCVPPYRETGAYVARILALIDGAGVILAPTLEVRLVR